MRLERLSEENFNDYEKLTNCNNSGCFCAFWHGKWKTVEEWKEREKTRPLENRELVRQKLRFGFHPGVLAYDGNDLVAWISVGPLPEYYWAWKRVAHLGETAITVGGIVCISVAPERRGTGIQPALLNALLEYGKNQNWKAIEGYPFDDAAYERHGKAVAWPGKTDGFVKSGFKRVGEHWINHPEWPRSIYQIEL